MNNFSICLKLAFVAGVLALVGLAGPATAAARALPHAAEGVKAAPALRAEPWLRARYELDHRSIITAKNAKNAKMQEFVAFLAPWRDYVRSLRLGYLTGALASLPEQQVNGAAAGTQDEERLSPAPILGLICAIVASSVALGVAIGLRRRIDRIAGPDPEKEADD